MNARPSRFSSALLAALTMFTVNLLTRVAHACPMCFNGSSQNADAFVVGSLFMMFVPTVTLGSLGYWAYRRIKAAEAASEPLVFEPPPPAAAAPENALARGPVVLRVVERG
jgi:hypothetical protein